MDTLLPAIADQTFDRLKSLLNHLGTIPPQVLLLEGGTEAQRLDAARYWAARVNCPEAATLKIPCLTCPVCLQIAAGEYLDLATYDGRISNKEDEEKPGSTRAFNMERVRELKSRLRDAPHGQGRRVVLLMGIGNARGEAANALLKTLEEPSATTLFTLLAPQREQLLPTLVSRSFCLTLPWPHSHSEDADMRPWEDCLADFLLQGKGFFDKTSAKGALDAASAARLLLCCQKAMSRILAGSNSPARRLDAALAGLSDHSRATACQWFSEAQQALGYGVSPSRVLEALAARLFALRHA